MKTISNNELSSKYLFESSNEILKNYENLTAEDLDKVANNYLKLIENTILYIILQENDPVMSFILRRLSRKVSYKLDSTAAVTYDDDEISLAVNPIMIYALELNMKQFIGIIKHEALHVLNNHFIRENKIIANKSVEERMLFNIAADLAINQYIPILANDDISVNMNTIFKMFPTMEQYLKRNSLTLKSKMSTEYYYNAIKESVPAKDIQEMFKSQNNVIYIDKKTYDDLVNDMNNGGGKTLDKIKDAIKQGKIVILDHSEINSSDSEFEKIASACKEIQDQLIKEGIADKKKGSGSSDYSEMIERLKQKPLIDWRKRFKNIVGSISYGKRGTFLRENRRLPERLELKGKLPARAIKAVIALDTSGSMSKRQLEEIFVEFESMKNNGAEFTIIECDYAITNVYTVKIDGNKNNAFNYNVHGRGGTAFTPVFEYIKKNHIKPDLFIYFTDGYGESSIPAKYALPPSTKIMWVLTGGTRRSISVKDPRFVKNVTEMKSRLVNQ